MFNDVYSGKKVLITGNTGFKGAWLTAWLIKLGAEVIGVSKDIPSIPSLYEVLDLSEKIKHYQDDIRDLPRMCSIIDAEKPDFVFHLAAQAIVSVSYEDPIDTVTSNVTGTVNILEALRKTDQKCVALMITSDKAYDNVEQVWGYKENDSMGGKDVYSGSKGAADILIKSYYYSFFKKDNSKVLVATARAGNVIGGGDWAKDRIVVDCMQAWEKGECVEIRSPESTRPWQHVLEPLSGYLNLAQLLYEKTYFNGESFNFGPRAEQNRTVVELLQDLGRYWNLKADNVYRITDNIPFNEAGLLKVCCDKALSLMKWYPSLEYAETVKLTSEWYYTYYKTKSEIFNYTMEQIQYFEETAGNRGLDWAK